MLELKRKHPKNRRRVTVSCRVANLSKKNGLPNSSRSVRHESVQLGVILELLDKLFTTFGGVRLIRKLSVESPGRTVPGNNRKMSYKQEGVRGECDSTRIQKEHAQVANFSADPGIHAPTHRCEHASPHRGDRLNVWGEHFFVFQRLQHIVQHLRVYHTTL
jgi:hypothetical protein